MKQKDIPKLQPMKTAPKNGEWVLVVWLTDGDDDLHKFDIALSRWWEPTELHQLESGARPHWEYIRSDFCRTVYHPIGWMWPPELSQEQLNSRY